MFCSNCGKKVNEEDNFCKFCGSNLNTNRINDILVSTCEPQKNIFSNMPAWEEKSIGTASEIKKEPEQLKEPPTCQINEDDEIVVYEIKKHYMALFWPCVFSPIFIAYFWIFYVNIPSAIGFIIALAVLAPIIYPVLRYFSDKSVITNQNLHIRQGAFWIEDICVPLNKIHLVRIRRSFLGRLADYGHLIIEKENSDKEIVYRYIQEPEDVEFILRNPKIYIDKDLKQ